MSAVSALKKLISQSVNVHPGDRARIESIIRQIVTVLDSALEGANGKEDLIAIGEALHELEITQYYIYSEVLRRIKNALKAQDAIQSYKWSRINKRLRRLR